jgi:hypothetical protein
VPSRITGGVVALKMGWWSYYDAHPAGYLLQAGSLCYFVSYRLEAYATLKSDRAGRHVFWPANVASFFSCCRSR